MKEESDDDYSMLEFMSFIFYIFKYYKHKKVYINNN